MPAQLRSLAVTVKPSSASLGFVEFLNEKSPMKFLNINKIKLVPLILLSLWQASSAQASAATQHEAPLAMPKAPIYEAGALTCKSQDDWNEATPARHIYGNSWYVGTCGISVVLIASPQGHVLIDSGPAAAFESVRHNILSLGLQLSDIKTLLTTHEHHDHAGAIAQLQQASGARVLVRAPAFTVMQTGQAQAGDPQFASLSAMQAVSNLQRIQDGARIKLAGKWLQNIPMPGHTLGGSAWSWRECQDGLCKTLVFADSLGAISDPAYRYGAPGGLASALRASAKRLAKQPCDLLITGHTGASDILDRLDGKEALFDTQACKEYAQAGLQNLAKRLQQEKNAP